jgi:molybdopterin synthase sulfur carrier subunit
MSVKIVIPSYLQPYTDNRETAEVTGKTIGECFNSLTERHPGLKLMLFNNNGKLHSYVGTYINGEDAYPDELSRPTRDGDEIHVIYIIGGG